MKHIAFVLLFMTLLSFLTSACTSEKSTDDLELAPVSALPQEVQSAPVAVRESYQFALANPDVLNKIPCYCGCGEGHGGEVPHKSVKDCFVREIYADGKVEWDWMGLG